MSDKFIFKNKDEEFYIEEIHNGDVETIVEFQKHLAIDSEGVQLNEENVRTATKFILENPEYGIHFIIRTLTPVQQSVSFALLCPEIDLYTNQQIWWYNSVFTEKSFRRRGFFTVMHEFILKWAGQNKIKLYADENNQGALQCYDKLGLKDTNEIFVEIDFFFSKEQISFERNQDIYKFSIGKPSECNQIFDSFNKLISISNKDNLDKSDGISTILKSIKQGGIVLIKEQNNNNQEQEDIIGLIVFGYEYSEWKKGHNLIITDVRLSQKTLQDSIKSQQVIQNLVSYLKNEQVELEASVQSIRFIVDRNNQKSIDLLVSSKLQLSHYIILSN
ncbi:GNAT family acetyltransferase (macronuclear) [Tetrahymena thermophila SB210]|uniref:GNAT family acetyltransferase n=1 Tax=Tetrahymena thermophila (strain SB210) TaxID=312017 RepID=I7LX80_TETTS|nr:GNAT family acetyltransferase [Tetrahymena thermophila SB210]EAS03923.2 GNAT family acetyltransferase [Tetrahymena thermophila SB210]|eukprot:XP_001024168.2 GNAT family acetyltransferase [Tetrahymena thermophila SB210]